MSVYYYRPARGIPAPVVVSIPHTGTDVPDQVAARFASAKIAQLPMTDWHLHDLYDFLPELGIATIYARFSRFCVDLNRSPDNRQLYPGRFETGLVPVETFDGEPVFREPPGAAQIEALRKQYHEPYHLRLSELLSATIARHARVVLVDAHSIASGANRIHAALSQDIYLGDRDGHSCAPWLSDGLAASFINEGLTVSRNNPYKGGYITEHYGQMPAVDAVQIEMCQRLYMNEAAPHDAHAQPFKLMQQRLKRVFAQLLRDVEAELE